MELSTELHLAAGIASLGMGGAVLLREPGRLRNRLFALLCGSLSLWNLGVVGNALTGHGEDRWNQALLLGSCAAAPLGLHFALVLAGGQRWRKRRLLLLGCYGLALLLWASSWTPAYDARKAWNLTAFAVLGLILIFALEFLRRTQGRLEPGPERRALRLLLVAAFVAAVGGLSDFLPRDASAFPKVGPVAVLGFLLIVCAILVRHRFLDIDVFLARAIALILGSAAAGVLLHLVVRAFGNRFLPLLIATLVILGLAGPAGRFLLFGARSLLRADDRLTRMLVSVSRKLPAAQSAEDVWRSVKEAQQDLPGNLEVAIYLRSQDGGSFVPVQPPGESGKSIPVPSATPLPRWLARKRHLVTHRLLREEADGDASAALQQLTELGAELVAPVSRRGELVGWIALGGAQSRRLLTDESAAAILAVGNQAAESLERIEAVALARRREALATVGEMAAGLAHEIRNPLAAMRGAAQVLQGETDETTGAEMLAVMEEETARLGRVVGEFLDYARPASPRRETVDLAALSRKVVRAAQAGGLELRVQVEMAPRTPPAWGDPDQLQRAFGNLVQNAADAAGPGGELRIEIRSAGAGQLAVGFHDNGPGIPIEELPRLFQPFHTTRSGGTGLGLALVHRVMESHGGDVHARNAPEGGALFTLTLPAGPDGGAPAPDISASSVYPGTAEEDGSK